MLKFFESDSSCHIVIEVPIVNDDCKMLENLLLRKYVSWHIEFGRVYNIDLKMIHILYKEIYINQKNVKITTHKHKLTRYLKGLGFKIFFQSLIKDDVVKLSDIEVVLIGGSADSSVKIKEIVQKTRLDNISLVIVQHVEANKVGLFDKILQRITKYKVSYAQDGKKLKKGEIYLAPSGKHLMVEDGFLLLNDGEKYNYSKPSVSISYESFSNFYKEKLLVIQECGYASDGVDKLSLLKRNNSKVIIQNIDECEAKPMIQNALNKNLHTYDFVLKDIITYINIIDNNTTREAWVEYLVEQIHKMHDYDFRLYHRDMVNRRLNIFMLKHDIKSIKDAIGIILFNRSAFKAFFLEISINVTELFRNPDSFELIAKLITKTHKHSRNLKLWSAGCSSGEEPYSLAILLDSLGFLDKSIIYATDFNNEIIQEAKNGVYSKQTYDLAKENFKQIGLKTSLDNYCIINNNYIMIEEKIKNKTLFFQHNLIVDSSFNEFDVIVCKNVIIYFNLNLQNIVFELLYNSLKFGGFLVLGESETIVTKYIDKFKQHGDSYKIFEKVA